MKSRGLILVVDDDAVHRSMLVTVLNSWDFQVDEADDGDVAIGKVRDNSYNLVLMDVRMAKMDGIAAMRGVLAYNPAIPVIMMTAFSSVESAVEAMRLGAFDYFVKPLDFELLRHVIRRAMEYSHIKVENRELRRLLSKTHFSGIVGSSKVVQELHDMINTVAPTEATVLIMGESGTGKELVAKAIHQASERKEQSLITVNCAAISEHLLESELFGHEKGAFTGADRRREGRFVQADGGTIFLDEIGEMPLPLQASLLRVLQNGEVQRVGSDSTLTVNVRVLAATNRNLAERVAEKMFREDLYFRLNVISIVAPPLREHPEDIPSLAAHFLDYYSKANRKTIKGFSPQAMDAFLRAPWPGNVRELENAVERAVILSNGEYITERELSPQLREGAALEAPHPPLLNGSGRSLAGLSLEELEKKAIFDTLKETDDNKSEAARRLGITRATLHNKLRRYGLE